MIPSCKKASKMLNESGILRRSYSEHILRARCESFGKKTYCFLSVDDMEQRKELEHWFYMNDIEFNKKYSKGEPVVEFRVRYFKAFGWNK